MNSPHVACRASRGKVSLMVWSCICYSAVGTLTHVEGNINDVKYIKTIDNNL